MTGGVRRAVVGAAAAQLVLGSLRPHAGDPRWQRSNFRGRQVSLIGGPALTVGLAASSAVPLPAGVAILGAAALGRHDDVAGSADAAKGLRGHLGALGHGRLTTGAAKLIGLPAVGVLAASMLRPRRPADVLLGAGVIAAAANAANLFDLRPGRALKLGLLAALAAGDPGIAGACAALLPEDLAERSMLGDTGANALGAALGVAVLRRTRRPAARAAALLCLAGLTLASERVSFSAVIDDWPALRAVDQLGRRA